MSDIFLIIGTIGTICFALSGLPQVLKAFKDGHSDGMAWGTVILWLVGEGATLFYTFYFYPTDLVFICNYSFNFILVFILFIYKIRSRIRLAQ